MSLRTSVSAAGAVTLVMAALAGADTRPLHRVSFGDPLAKCTSGVSRDGVNYPASEVEPWVAVDPRHPSRVIGAFQQDRWSDGGAKGVVATYSSDGRHFAGNGPSYRPNKRPGRVLTPGKETIE